MRGVLKRLGSILLSVVMCLGGGYLIDWWWRNYYTQTYTNISPLIEDLAVIALTGGVMLFIGAILILIFYASD